MRIINFLNLKGGVAKTFSVVNMAYELWRRGYKVLILDNDALCRIRHNGSYTEKIVIPKFLIQV